jgi:hypothetical protein
MSPVYLFIQILIGFQPNRFVTKYSQKKPKVYTSCLPMVGGSLRLLPPLKLAAMILLKVALKHKKSNQNHVPKFHTYSCKKVSP